MHDFRGIPFGLIFSKPLIGLMGQPDNVVELAALFRYCSFSLIPLIFFRVQAICGWNEQRPSILCGQPF
jgi:Na+-driven multidrug efflux pump